MVQGLQSVGLLWSATKTSRLTGEEAERHTRRGTDCRRIGLPVQGQSNERTGQGTMAYGQFAEGAVRYDVVRARARDGTGRVGK